ncbi:PREDICTED: uncharacterized protein LOC109175259 isoform X2 [Ipomoea nil]|uniref:uncharacterized protein LOC109175259 isoform X2 n=1 Tax=Ipomoea nil TaxID=35883 RepID=UPI000901F2FF|nr:PREDICTED: uncharacterized protein LOC109175259 isoform X2 [Ipomoea nil]
MEDLRKAAKYYYETGSEEYKQRARRAMDGGETLEEFYVRETKRGIRRCDVCAKLVVGFYLCCTKCELFKGYNYNLCVECFYGRTFQHNHDTFADNHSVMMMHNDQRFEPSCVIEKNNGKGKRKSNSKGDASSSHHSKPISHDSSLKGSGGHSKSTHRDSSSTDSSHSKPINHDSSLKGSGRHSKSTHHGSSSTDPSDSKAIIPVSNLRDSSQSNSTGLSVRKIMIDKKGIEALANVARAHYDAAPKKIRNSADEFFWSMVKQEGKTRVAMEDFVESMKEKRYPEYALPELFKMVVKDRNVGMSIMESRTIYYIVVSGRPFCSWCNCFICDVYFCCSKCSARSYALCLRCYSAKAYVNHTPHYKDADVFFLDYSVLHSTINVNVTPAASHSHREGGGSSRAIVERNPRDDRVVGALRVGQAILNVGAAVLTIASTLGACTIM